MIGTSLRRSPRRKLQVGHRAQGHQGEQGGDRDHENADQMSDGHVCPLQGACPPPQSLAVRRWHVVHATTNGLPGWPQPYRLCQRQPATAMALQAGAELARVKPRHDGRSQA